MNVIKMRQEERLRRIATLQQSIEDSETKDIDRLVMMACGEWGATTRYVKELIKIAQYNLECQTKTTSKGEDENIKSVNN